MKRLSLSSLMALVLVFPMLASATDATIKCPSVTTYEDGSAIPPGSAITYSIYGGLQGQPKILRDTSTGCSFTRQNLSPGIQEWYLTATLGLESAPSITVSKTVTATTECPAAPAPESHLVACAAPTIGSWTQTRGWISVAAPACWEAGPWTPAAAPAGVCASPPPALVTSDTKAFELRGTATVPSLSFVGLVQLGRPCGPETQIVNGLKYCRVPVWRADGSLQVALTNSPLDFKTVGVWARTP